MYQPHCGLENVLMSWGHDGEAHRGWQQGWPACAGGPSLWVPGDDTLSPTEYMYQMMKFNKFSLPPEVGGRVGRGKLSVQPHPVSPRLVQPNPAQPRDPRACWESPQLPGEPAACWVASSCPQAFYMIRFHSFYPWHTGGDYRHLCSEQDLAMLPWVQEFKYSHPLGNWG